MNMVFDNVFTGISIYSISIAITTLGLTILSEMSIIDERLNHFEMVSGVRNSGKNLKKFSLIKLS